MAQSYSGEHAVDYTNTNPDYWAGVNQFFQTNAENQQGETGIWIPNLEKQGAEATALAASAGGVNAVGGSNYAGGSRSGSGYTRADGTVVPGRMYGNTGVLENTRSEYQTNRPIKLASIYRGGTEYTQTDAGDTYGGGTRLGNMGTLPASWQGGYLQGRQVTDQPI